MIYVLIVDRTCNTFLCTRNNAWSKWFQQAVHDGYREMKRQTWTSSCQVTVQVAFQVRKWNSEKFGLSFCSGLDRDIHSFWLSQEAMMWECCDNYGCCTKCWFTRSFCCLFWKLMCHSSLFYTSRMWRLLRIFYFRICSWMDFCLWRHWHVCLELLWHGSYVREGWKAWSLGDTL